MDLTKLFKKKEMGLPAGVQWNLIKGLFVPMDGKDSTYIDQGFKAIPVIQFVISRIIDKASDAPQQIMRVTNNRKAKQYQLYVKNARTAEHIFKAKTMRVKAFEQDDDHPFIKLLENPNPIETGKTLAENQMGYLLLTGNSYEYAALPGMGARASQPRELWTIPSPSVKPVMSDDRRNPLKGYQIGYMGDNDIEPLAITHVKYFNPVSSYQGFENTLVGLSPLRSGVTAISQRKYADIAQGSLFANGAPAGLISGTKDDSMMTQDQGVAINDSFRKNHMGVHNVGDIIVTPADVKWVNIGLSPVDLDILKFNQDFERQIANVYGYPTDLLMPNSITANSEEANKRLITNCVLPLLRRYDDARTQKIRQWYGDDRLVCISDLQYYPELQEDREKQSKWLKDCYWLTTSEKRAVMDYEQEYDADDMLVPQGLVPLSDIQAGELEVDRNMEI